MSSLTRTLISALGALTLVMILPRGALALTGNYNCLGTATFSFPGGGQVYGFTQLIHLNLSGSGSTLTMNYPASNGFQEVCKFAAIATPVAKVDATGQGTLTLKINANVGDVDHDPGLNCDEVFNRLPTPTLHYLIATVAGGTRFYFTPNDDYDTAPSPDSGDFIVPVSGVCEKSP